MSSTATANAIAKTEKNIIIADIDKRQVEIARSKIPSLFINKKYNI